MYLASRLLDHFLLPACSTLLSYSPQARGLTWFIPGEDATLISKQQIFARVVGALGGRAAEEVVFGDAEVTSGASSDLQQVRGRASTGMLACWLWLWSNT